MRGDGYDRFPRYTERRTKRQFRRWLRHSVKVDVETVEQDVPVDPAPVTPVPASDDGVQL